MRLYRALVKKVSEFAPGVWGGALGAVVAFSAVLFLPGDSCAYVQMSAGGSYQNTETTTANKTTSSTQERFTAVMRMNTRFSTKLSINANLGFDIITRKSNAGESTEIQPNIVLRFLTKSVQLNTGYRQVLSDSTTTTGVTTTTRTTTTSETFADTTIRAGRLPNMRVRYITRGQRSEDSSGNVVDTTNNDLGGSMNYSIGIINLNADASVNENVNNTTNEKTDSLQVSGLFLANKKFSSKMNMSLRENYLLSKVNSSSGQDTKNTVSTTEARLNLNPIDRSDLKLGYIFSTQRNEKNEATGDTVNKLEENRWFTSGSYALPKMLRFYGSYSNRTLDTSSVFSAVPPAVSSDKQSESISQVTTLGVNFKRSFGRLGVISRYEKRINQSDITTTTNGVTSTAESRGTRDNIDWLVTADVNRFLKCSVSEAYVLTKNRNGENENNRYRIKLDVGPIMKFVLSPYLDYQEVVNTPKNGASSKSTSTELVVPVNYSTKLGEKVKFDFRDDYRMRTAESARGKTRSSSNVAVLRLTIPQLTKSLSLSGDATFSTTSTDTASTSSSAYTARLSWSRTPHRLSANIKYQTAQGRPSTTGFGVQYSLSLKMKKISMAFSGTYTYTTTSGSNAAESSGQTIYLTLTLRN